MPLLELDLNPPPRLLRRFAVACPPALLVLVGLLMTFKGLAPLPAAVTVAAGVLVWLVSLVSLTPVRWVYVALTVLTWPIGVAMSFVLLAVVYFGVVTPIGLVFRLLGRDPLQRRFDPDATSYWQPHHQVRDPGRYFNQF